MRGKINSESIKGEHQINVKARVLWNSSSKTWHSITEEAGSLLRLSALVRGQWSTTLDL